HHLQRPPLRHRLPLRPTHPNPPLQTTLSQTPRPPKTPKNLAPPLHLHRHPIRLDPPSLHRFPRQTHHLLPPKRLGQRLRRTHPNPPPRRPPLERPPTNENDRAAFAARSLHFKTFSQSVCLIPGQHLLVLVQPKVIFQRVLAELGVCLP